MRYIIGLLIAIGLVIALIFVIASGGNGDEASKVPSTQKLLQEYANTDATVRMTVAGPVVAETEHREMRISINRNQSTIEYISGYQGNVIASESNPNSRESFVVFLRAIDRTGFTNGNTDKALRDERGYCPLGKRYIFELIENGKTLQRFWTTNCSEVETFLGERGLTATLFVRQIPSYNELLNDDKALSLN